MSEQQPYGYYYGNEAEQYTFYRLPKALFTDNRYKDLSDGAKILYGLMLDRMGLSVKNCWLDEQDRVFIIFTLEDTQEYMNCQHGKAVKLFAELDTEKGIGLIERVRQGQGKPAIIYVRKFFDTAEIQTSENRKSRPPENEKCRLPKNGSQDFRNSAANKNYLSNNDFSDIDSNDTDSIPFTSPTPLASMRGENPERKGTEAASTNTSMTAFDAYREIILANIEYPYLLERHKFSKDRIDEIVDLMLETVCTARKTIRIAGDDYPAELVKSKFLKLDSEHIDFVLDCLQKNTTEIRNIKKYLLAMLFNAPSTIGSYYTALVAHDMASGLLSGSGNHKDGGSRDSDGDPENGGGE